MDEDSDASKPLVLIVEDDPILSMDLAEILKEWNYAVCGVAGTAAKALELAARHKPRLALVDVGLRGEMDGIDLAVRLRREFSLPSIIITGALSSALTERAEAARPAGFLAKPYMPWELEKVLAEAWPQRVPAAP
jgi:two-component system, response regulator PdtaR